MNKTARKATEEATRQIQNAILKAADDMPNRVFINGEAHLITPKGKEAMFDAMLKSIATPELLTDEDFSLLALAKIYYEQQIKGR